MRDAGEVLKVLRSKGMSISDRFQGAFAGGEGPEDGPEWFGVERVCMGPHVDLRGPLGFWSLGQFGTGIQIGVMGGRDGRVADRLYMVGFEGAWYGDLPMGDELDPPLHQMDECDLEDAFQAMPDADYPLLAVSSVGDHGVGSRPWDGVRPLYFNCGSFDSTAVRSRYESVMSEALATFRDRSVAEPFDVFREESWLELRDLGSDERVPDGDWRLVAEENILVCRSLAGADDAGLSQQLRSCQRISEALGHHWLSFWCGDALAQGGF